MKDSIKKQASDKRYREAHPERKLADTRRYRARHPDRVKASERKQQLRRNFGLTLDQFDALHSFQDGLCSICHRPPCGKKRSLCVDHCHATGRIRGLLCNHCNVMLAMSGDSIETLLRAVEYLEGNPV